MLSANHNHLFSFMCARLFVCLFLVQVDYLTGSLRVNGGDLGSEYEVAQFQFHWGSNDSQGSEHTTDGRPYPMEVFFDCKVGG